MNGKRERSYVCGTCGARIGQPCRTRTGNVAGAEHVDRVNKADDAYFRSRWPGPRVAR